ncbi:MAG: MFS transporter [Mycobacteriales bacterium]
MDHGLARWEPARPRRVASWRHAHWLAVVTVCVGAFMGQLDASIVSLALPAIGHDLGGSAAGVEWVALAYLLTLVGLVAPVGGWADAAGRKLLYLAGFATFTAASLGCGLATNLAGLDAARVVQGAGAALMQANSVALIATVVPTRLLGRAIGVQGAAQAVGLALGPSVGGLLLAAGSWRLLFLVNLPAGLVGLVGGWYLLPRSRHLRRRQPLDRVGLAQFVPAVTALMLALSLAARPHAATAPAVVAAAVAVLLGVLFVRHVRRHPAPLLDPGLVAARPVATGLVAGLLSYTALFGLLFVAPHYLRGTLRLGPRGGGLLLTVLPAALALAAPAGGLVADRRGARAATAAGMALSTAGLAGLAAYAAAGGGGRVAVGALLATTGAGLGLFTPANNAAVMAAAPPRAAGATAGVLNMTRGLGTALGIAGATLAYALAAGGRPGPDASRHGMAGTALLLAAAAALAGLVGGAAQGRAPRRILRPWQTARTRGRSPR